LLAKAGKDALDQQKEMSASYAVDEATGRTNVAIKTEIAGAPHTGGEVAADQEAVAADHHPAITREEAAVIQETMADQRSLRKDAALSARRRVTSSAIALTLTEEVAIALREVEVVTEEGTGISDADAIPEVVLLAETTTGTEDGSPRHALPHAASVSTQGQGLHLPAGTPPVTWTGTAGAPNTIELFSEIANPSRFQPN